MSNKIKVNKSSVQSFLEKKIKPFIQLDGGDIQFADYDADKKIVKVRLLGACVGCPMSVVTLKMGVEKEIKKEFPQIKEVITID